MTTPMAVWSSTSARPALPPASPSPMSGVKKVGQEDMSRQEKTVLADGNYVYNGKFQEGEKRLGYWSVWELGSSQVTVTNDNNVRRLRIEAGPLHLHPQPRGGLSERPGPDGRGYALSFDAEGAAGKNITVQAAGPQLQGGDERQARRPMSTSSRWPRSPPATTSPSSSVSPASTTSTTCGSRRTL